MEYAGDLGIVKCENGFTLLEVVIALVIFGMVMSVAGMGIVSGISAYQTSRENVSIAQRAQLALARINRELMELTQIAKIEDSNDDTELDTIYYDSASGIRRAIRLEDDAVRIYPQLAPDQEEITGETGHTLIDRVDIFSMRFFSGTDPWTVLNSPDNLQLLSLIEITLTLNRSDSVPAAHQFVFLIHPRNIDSNGGANV